MYYTRQTIEGEEGEEPQVITTEHKVAFGDTLRLFDANAGAPGNTEIVFYACWTPLTGYNLIYDPAGGSYTPAPREVGYEDKNLMPTDADQMTKHGYRLAGWYATRLVNGVEEKIILDDQGNYLITAETMFRTIAASADTSVVTTLHAEWVVGNVDLVFDTDGNGYNGLGGVGTSPVDHPDGAR